MKILMFGRGVMTMLYGWAFGKMGHHIDFYVRPGRIEQFPAEVGLDIFDLRQKKKHRHIVETLRTHLRDDLPSNHDYDLIFLGVNHHQFESAAQFLSTRASDATILILTQFWDDPQKAAACLPQDQLAWGFPLAGGGVDADNVLRGAIFNAVVFGTFGKAPSARELQARQLFRDAGWRISDHRNFRDWLWVHFVTHAGMSAQVLRAGSVGAVMTDPGQAKQMIYNVREAAKVLAVRGVDVRKHPELLPFYLPAWIGQYLITWAFRSNVGLRAMTEGHTKPQEILQVYYDFMDNSFGVPLPRMEALRSGRIEEARR
ncbi:ketopantoate reductase family protein [Sphingobium subterraneum]|nr:2-dehydropantoate 2-reductase N-terminal domain-containing protein [Sphingobium subterraneum]